MMNLKTPIVTLLALACLVAGLSAADSSPANGAGQKPAEYLHTVWTTEHGLPQNSVTAILQTRDGYLWIGTFGGLVRFDGVKFTLVEGPGPRSNRILTLFEDHAGAVWIGTERGGATRYANGAFTTYTEKDGLPFDNVAS